MMAPPPTITVEQQQQQPQMMAPPPTTTVEKRQQQMMITPPPPITKEQQQQQQQMMAPPQTSVQSKLMNPAKTTMQQPIEIPRRDYPIYSAPRATEVMCTVTKQMKVQCTNAISVGTTPSESRGQMLAPPRVPVQQTVRVTRSDGSLYTPRTTDVTCTTSTPLTTQPSPAISYYSRPHMNKPQRITPPRVSARQTLRVPRTGQSPYFNPRAAEATYSSYPPYNYYKRPAHHNEPQILNLSVPRPSEVFQNLQTDILDLSASRKSTPSTSEDEHLMTLEDTHQTRAQSVFSPDSPRTTPSTCSSPTPSETETPYSPTMPY